MLLRKMYQTFNNTSRGIVGWWQDTCILFAENAPEDASI